MHQTNKSVSTLSGRTRIKIVLLGNQSVGKTCIIEKYIKDEFDETANPTIGIDFLIKNVNHQSKNYRLQLWDTAGQQRFRSLIPNYLKDAKCAIIVTDVTCRSSLNSVKMWYEMFEENSNVDRKVFMVANKTDFQFRQFTEEEGQKMAKSLGIFYLEISAKTGRNIHELFHRVIDAYENRIFPTDEPIHEELDETEIKESQKCAQREKSTKVEELKEKEKQMKIEEEIPTIKIERNPQAEKQKQKNRLNFMGKQIDCCKS